MGYSLATPRRTLVDVAAAPLSQAHLNRAVADALGRGLVLAADLMSAPAADLAAGRLRQALATRLER